MCIRDSTIIIALSGGNSMNIYGRFSSPPAADVALAPGVDPHQGKDETVPRVPPYPNTIASRTPPPEYHPSAPPSHPPWDAPTSHPYGSGPSSIRTDARTNPSIERHSALEPIGPPRRVGRSSEESFGRSGWEHLHPAASPRTSCPPGCTWNPLSHHPSHQAGE